MKAYWHGREVVVRGRAFNGVVPVVVLDVDPEFFIMYGGHRDILVKAEEVEVVKK